jgi:hypothetical protein
MPISTPRTGSLKSSIMLPKAFSVVKGAVSALSENQRELVSVFVEYLRHLPPLETWVGPPEDDPYKPLCLLLIEHYKVLYPGWNLRHGALPESEIARCDHMIQRAATPEDHPVRTRRRRLKELGEARTALTKSIDHYQSERVRLGFGLDSELGCEATTPLETAGEATWPGMR